jgi:hypothetical protein
MHARAFQLTITLQAPRSRRAKGGHVGLHLAHNVRHHRRGRCTGKSPRRGTGRPPCIRLHRRPDDHLAMGAPNSRRGNPGAAASSSGPGSIACKSLDQDSGKSIRSCRTALALQVGVRGRGLASADCRRSRLLSGRLKRRQSPPRSPLSSHPISGAGRHRHLMGRSAAPTGSSADLIRGRPWRAHHARRNHGVVAFGWVALPAGATVLTGAVLLAP